MGAFMGFKATRAKCPSLRDLEIISLASVQLSTGDGLVSFSSIPPYIIRFVAETNFMKKESMFRLLVQRKETLTTMIISKRPARMKISLERIAEIVCH